MLIIWRNCREVRPRGDGTPYWSDLVMVARCEEEAREFAILNLLPETLNREILNRPPAVKARAGWLPLTACEILIVPEGGSDD